MSIERISLDSSSITDKDLPFEYQLQEDPYNLTNWLRYYWHKNSIVEKVYILRRACYQLQNSYKLWILYLDHRIELLQGLQPVGPYQYDFRLVNEEFEIALSHLNKMPMLWIKYLEFLIPQPDIRLTIRTFNTSLRTLPLTQHDKIWKLFLEFGDELGGSIGSSIYSRYLIYKPLEIELVLEKYLEFGDHSRSLDLYKLILNDETFISSKDKSPSDFYLECLELLQKLPPNSNSNDDDKIFETFIRQGLNKFPDQFGHLYTELAIYFTNHRSNILKSQIIYEEGLSKCQTIKDFTTIYESYTEFLEKLIKELMIKIEESPDPELDDELDLRLHNFEKLMDNREFLINDIKLKQNSNNVDEWLHRISIISDSDISLKLQTYVKAITTIIPQKSTPGLYKLWLGYSRIYEDNQDLQTARSIFDKATKVQFNSIDELVNIWLEWANLEIRQDDIDTAIRIMEVATKCPNNSKIDINDTTIAVQKRIHKSVKLWSFYLDLIESSGDIDETRKVYEKLFDLKIITPLILINYANFLEDMNHFEESFKIYERGLRIFKFPVAFEIWNIYLVKIMKRKVGIERIRDLFDRVLESCPKDLSKQFYILYSNFENENGLYNKSITILLDAVTKVNDDSKVDVYKNLILKLKETNDIDKLRSVYEDAISIIPIGKNLDILLDFINFETSLSEFIRVRDILKFSLKQKSLQKLWDVWRSFETENGDKDTFKQMLKFKRELNTPIEVDYTQTNIGFVKSSEGPKVSSINASENSNINPDSIDLDI
ncbi:hypothetical protein WICMUC_003719 [Wickerhamomyces mucosus]|uniref:Pre-mRNA-splicing factor SYF1 n=1 Tax=Wickerhamomyces mucosus TaxID=1378264 RepID=A0A9P8PKJ6_9ASCO|nr:hypothetical protein WICMUC_003719 [Wickerhamomyces mucosus]